MHNHCLTLLEPSRVGTSYSLCSHSCQSPSTIAQAYHGNAFFLFQFPSPYRALRPANSRMPEPSAMASIYWMGPIIFNQTSSPYFLPSTDCNASTSEISCGLSGGDFRWIRAILEQVVVVSCGSTSVPVGLPSLTQQRAA